MRQNIFSKLSLFAVLLVYSSCGVYSFSGASIPKMMKTVSVAYFENQSLLIMPTLSQSLTEALKERIRNQTALSILRYGVPADGVFEGRITDYSVKAISVQGNETSALSRLSITVSVSYHCEIDPKLNFEQSFTRYQDFSTTAKTFEQQELDLVQQINTQLVEDIFNRAFANW